MASAGCEFWIGPIQRSRAEFAAYADKHGFENLCRVLFNVSEFVFVDALPTAAFQRFVVMA